MIDTEGRLSIFNNGYVAQLSESIDTHTYSFPELSYPEECVLRGRLMLDKEIPVLEPLPEQDWLNAIRLHDYLEELSRVQASDKRLWTTMTHVDFRNYMQLRWRPDSVDSIKKRWFITGSKGMVLNGLARLWWGAELTVAPWEGDEWLSILESEDRYKYTKILFKDTDLYQNIMERNFSHNNRITTSILYFLDNNQAYMNRDGWRSISKEINLLLAYRKIETLSFDEFQELIERQLSE